MNEPLITSILDSDLYKFTMGQLIFHDFPEAIVHYKFINRAKTPFPDGFGDELKNQLQFLSKVHLTIDEQQWLNKIPYLRHTYIEWLKGYRFDPTEIKINQIGGELNISIDGLWFRTILWEVPLMALISEMYFKLTNQSKSDDWEQRIENTGVSLSVNSCHWIDFGTRRRYSLGVQDIVVKRMKMLNGFLGTSNPYLAFKYGVVPHGTFAHEFVMGMSAVYGVRMANVMATKHWANHFNGDLGVALTDTFTTEVFRRDFGNYEARLYDGVRQDSGDPFIWGEEMLKHYRTLNILTSNKRFVFSDGLNDKKYIGLDKHFRQFAQPIGGIGTFLSNNVGVKPLNMVVKLDSIKINQTSDFVDVVKLSDDPGKHTGNPEAIAQVKRELNIL